MSENNVLVELNERLKKTRKDLEALLRDLETSFMLHGWSYQEVVKITSDSTFTLEGILECYNNSDVSFATVQSVLVRWVTELENLSKSLAQYHHSKDEVGAGALGTAISHISGFYKENIYSLECIRSISVVHSQYYLKTANEILEIHQASVKSAKDSEQLLMGLRGAAATMASIKFTEEFASRRDTHETRSLTFGAITGLVGIVAFAYIFAYISGEYAVLMPPKLPEFLKPEENQWNTLLPVIRHFSRIIMLFTCLTVLLKVFYGLYSRERKLAVMYAHREASVNLLKRLEDGLPEPERNQIRLSAANLLLKDPEMHTGDQFDANIINLSPATSAVEKGFNRHT